MLGRVWHGCEPISRKRQANATAPLSKGGIPLRCMKALLIHIPEASELSQNTVVKVKRAETRYLLYAIAQLSTNVVRSKFDSRCEFA